MFRLDIKGHRWAFFFCAVASIGSLCYGYDNTYYNGVLGMAPFIDAYGDHFENGKKALAVSFTSLTASSIYIGDLLGALLAAPINDKLGRKSVFWSASFCVLFGGIAQVADTHYEGVIILGRVFIGLGVGQFTVTSLLYIGEVAPASIRGPALMMFQFLQSCSQLIASGITKGTSTNQTTLSYRIPMGGLIVLPLIMFIGLPFIPESPTWFVSKDRAEDAADALRRINKGIPSYNPSADVVVLEEARQRERERAENSSWRSLIVDPVERRKTFYSAGAMFAQQINGILFFYVYGVVYAQAIGIKQPFTISLITNTLQIFAVGASVVLGNQISRRRNLLVTTAFMFFAFIVIGGIGTQRSLSKADQYVIVIFSYIIVATFNFGLGPLAYTVAREMAVGRNQNKIMSVSIVVFFVTTWAVAFTAPYLYYSANLQSMLGFVYAGTTVLSLLYIWFCVGETTGRTNLEIESFFQDQLPVRRWKHTTFPGVDDLIQEKQTQGKCSAVEQIEGVV